MKNLAILLILAAFVGFTTANSPTTEPPPPTPTNTSTEQVHEDLPNTTESDEISEIFGFSENENGEESGENGDLPNLANFPIRHIDEFNSWNFLGENDTHAWQLNENDETVLYVINSDIAEVLAVFPPGLSHEREDIFGDLFPNQIWEFGQIDDWIILSLGYFMGTANNFFGSLVRLREDGSQLTHFAQTTTPQFFIDDGWLYFWSFDWFPGNTPSLLRTRADGSDMQDFSEFISSIIAVRNGYIYGDFVVFDGESNSFDFVRFNTESGEKITLFAWENLPVIDGRLSAVYAVDSFSENYIYFTVQIWGNPPSSTTWDWRNRVIYMAKYRVSENGENLELLNEQFWLD